MALGTCGGSLLFDIILFVMLLLYSLYNRPFLAWGLFLKYIIVIYFFLFYMYLDVNLHNLI